jgi:eukaryotic-like serine/threonine-protein kinase
MQPLKRFLTSYRLLCPLLGLILLALSLIDYPPLRQLDLPIYDRLVSLRPTPKNDQVVLLAIDQQSRHDLGEAAGSHQVLSLLLDKLTELGVRQIGLLTPLSFPAGSDTDQQQARETDRALAERLQQARPVLAVESLGSATLTADTLPRASSLPLPPSATMPRQLLLARKNPLAAYRCNRPEPIQLLPPEPLFQQEQLPLGHQLFPVDADGQIRSQLLLLPSRERLVAALPLQLALRFRQADLQALSLPPRELPGVLQGGGLQIAIGRDYRLLLNISGRELPFQRYSASQLLAGMLDENQLRDKIVLVGATESIGDRHPLATRGELSTSELTALATASLLTGRQLQRPTWSWQVEALVLVYFTVLLLLLAPRLSFRAGLFTLGLFLATWLLAAAAGLVYLGFWLQVTPAVLLGLIGFALVRRDLAQREKRISLQESNRLLALSFQEQGLLDLALEKILRVPPADKVVKEMLYTLGLDFERKRMPHKAQTAYRHLLQGGRFRDSRERLKQLERHDRTVVLEAGADTPLSLHRPGEKPTLGRYRIEKELGQGAMGTVYLGSDPKINRQVAIKTLAYRQIDPDQLPQIKARFFREAEAAGRLNHPQIVTIYDVGEESDLAYLAMELLDGRDLSHYCQAKNLLPAPRVIGLLAQVARAIDYAHRQGVIHRDLKPANIIVVKDWQVKVVDFGVARVVSSSRTETGVILGTPSYMSPEQIAGKTVDGRSDLFSLGVVMYELLSGAKPFVGDSLTALMYNISHCNYRPLNEISPRIPEGCQAILGRLLLKGTGRRFRTAAVLADELEALQQTLEQR